MYIESYIFHWVICQNGIFYETNDWKGIYHAVFSMEKNVNKWINERRNITTNAKLLSILAPYNVLLAIFRFQKNGIFIYNRRLRLGLAFFFIFVCLLFFFNVRISSLSSRSHFYNREYMIFFRDLIFKVLPIVKVEIYEK